MNTTDYFTNINAMFPFCIFIFGLLVWAVIWGLNTKNALNKDLKTAYNRIKQADMDIANEMRKYDTIFKQHIERGKRIIALEVAKDNAGMVSRDLRKQLDHAEADRIELRAERATLENKVAQSDAALKYANEVITSLQSKVRKRDKDGKFLPSGNSRARTVKKLKLVTDMGENDVIHCKTAKERLAVRTLMHEAGLKWATNHSYMEREYFSDYGKNLYYRPKSGTHGDIDMIEESMTTIHHASDFIARPKRVKKVSLKVSADISAVEDAIQGVNNAFSKIKELVDAQPKLIHGLTVKNPTEDEAKMIFDEARRLGIEVEEPLRATSSFPWIQYFAGKIESCIDLETDSDEYVTAKEFVQRMQNGRG